MGDFLLGIQREQMAFGSVFFVSRAVARGSETLKRVPQQIWCQKNATFSSCPFWYIYTQSLTPTFDVLGTQCDMVRSKAHENLHKLSPIFYDTLVSLALVSGKNGSGMPTSDKFSGRVELSHFILGGLPDVNHSLPYFRPGGCDSGRCAHRHESGVVLATLGPGLRSVLTQSGCRLPGACRRGTARRRCAPLWSGPGIWPLGHSASREGVAPGGAAGRPVAHASV